MDGNVIVQLLIALGGGAAMTAIIGGFFQKNKVRAEQKQISAEAAQIITNAAEQLANNYRVDNQQLRDQLAETRDKLQVTETSLQTTQEQLRINGRELVSTNERLDKAIDMLTAMGGDVSTLVRQGRTP